MAYGTFYRTLDYPDMAGTVSFLAVQDGDEPALWHGRYELMYSSSGSYGVGEPDFVLGERDIEVPPGWDAEDYLAEACDDGDEPGVPQEIMGMWEIDRDLLYLSEEYDTKAKTLREILDEHEGGALAGFYDEYAAFAKANRWAFRGLDGDAS